MGEKDVSLPCQSPRTLTGCVCRYAGLSLVGPPGSLGGIYTPWTASQVSFRPPGSLREPVPQGQLLPLGKGDKKAASHRSP